MTGDSQAPTALFGSSERSLMLDALRGWALLGILIANMMSFCGYYDVNAEARGRMVLAGLNETSEFLLEWLVVGKFYCIFSLLFGIGFAIHIRRLEERGESVVRYLRRLALLFVIGLAHILLLWLGDILALYALMGAVLLLFRRLDDRTLLVAAVICWLVALGWSAAINFAGFRPYQPFFDLGLRLIGDSGQDVSQWPLSVLAGPDILPHLRTHPGEAFIRLGNFVYQMRFTKVLGMFLVGLWIGRRAIHANPDGFRPLLWSTCRAGLLIGLSASALKAILNLWTEAAPAITFVAEICYVIGTPLLALGYASMFVLLCADGRHVRLGWAAPAGQMALTNYLMQTVLQSALFYGWGLGMIGTLGLAFVVPLSILIFTLQVACSRRWLRHFRFGPVEWLWRSLTYGRAQPMRCQAD